jgi:hypothetical protein
MARTMRSMLAVLILAAACGPKITMVKTNPPPRPMAARSAETVEIFTTKLPSRPYIEVAVFSASKGKAEDHMDALRERAGSYGCDGLVFTVMPHQSDVTTTTVSSNPGEVHSGGGTAVGSSSATCVVWTEPAPAAGPPPVPAAAEPPTPTP